MAHPLTVDCCGADALIKERQKDKKARNHTSAAKTSPTNPKKPRSTIKNKGAVVANAKNQAVGKRKALASKNRDVVPKSTAVTASKKVRQRATVMHRSIAGKKTSIAEVTTMMQRNRIGGSHRTSVKNKSGHPIKRMEQASTKQAAIVQSKRGQTKQLWRPNLSVKKAMQSSSRPESPTKSNHRTVVRADNKTRKLKITIKSRIDKNKRPKRSDVERSRLMQGVKTVKAIGATRKQLLYSTKATKRPHSRKHQAKSSVVVRQPFKARTKRY